MTTSTLDVGKTANVRARYNRVARFYDLMERGNDKRFAPTRKTLWGEVQGPRVLEVGVGTGRNFPLYPQGAQVTAIDLSPRMLERARRKLGEAAAPVELREADVQALPFPDGSFDTVVSTFVFCSVPNPVLGLQELRRVLRPSGQLLMLEHVLSEGRLLRPIMSLLNPIVVRVMGANINRETPDNVRRAGFEELQTEAIWLDVVKVIHAWAPEV